jgi:hypothetical protein
MQAGLLISTSRARNIRKGAQRRELEGARLGGERVEEVGAPIHVRHERGRHIETARPQLEMPHNLAHGAVAPTRAHVADGVTNAVLVRAREAVEDRLHFRQRQELLVHEAQEAAVAHRGRKHRRDDKRVARDANAASAEQVRKGDEPKRALPRKLERHGRRRLRRQQRGDGDKVHLFDDECALQASLDGDLAEEAAELRRTPLSQQRQIARRSAELVEELSPSLVTLTMYGASESRSTLTEKVMVRPKIQRIAAQRTPTP